MSSLTDWTTGVVASHFMRHRSAEDSITTRGFVKRDNGTATVHAWLAICVVAIGTYAPAAPADVETLRLISYNVRNLPDSLFESRRPALLDVLEHYDVALLQENFAPGGIHESWTGGAFRGPEPASRWYYRLAPLIRLSGYQVPYDSGLSILLSPNLTPRWSAEKIVDEAYGSCHGIVRHSHDCWANKGLLGVRLTAPDGWHVDLYTTHLEAGGDAADQRVRRAQIARMTELIEAHSDANALVLAGDFNTPRRRPDDFQALMESVQTLELSDSGARPRNDDMFDCQLDFVFVRSSDEVDLEVVEAHEPRATFARSATQGVDFCNESWRGRALSDHPALAVELELRATE